MIVYPQAKINLGLNITARREDGYHDIETVFYPVPFHDILEVNFADHDQFTLSGLAIPGGAEDNLCLKALSLLRERVNVPPVHIHLHKQIPTGGGLGGGSSDGAATINAINNLAALGLDLSIRGEIAARLGSDCSFFLNPMPSAATGRGERVCPLDTDPLKGYWLLLCNPGIHVSTAWAYSMIEPDTQVISPWKVIASISPENWKDHLINAFEGPVFRQHKQIAAIRDMFYESGALLAMLSGSGSSVFGIYEKPPQEFSLPGGLSYKVFQLGSEKKA